MSAYEKIYTVVRQIPYGQVATYGQIADYAGYPGQARLVGYALYRVTDDQQIPWHRVINAKGEVSRSPHRQGTDQRQRQLLEQEDIHFSEQGRLNLSVSRWAGPPAFTPPPGDGRDRGT
jgi:methylated-DNA-protein-cysteine methyltransferase-like protein